MKLAITTFVLLSITVGSVAIAADAVKPAVPYDALLDGWKQVQGAAQKAESDGKRVLVIVGGNWCKWCRALDSLMVVNAELKGEIAAHYELVHLNWSKENKNAEAMAHLGNPRRSDSRPSSSSRQSSRSCTPRTAARSRTRTATSRATILRSCWHSSSSGTARSSTAEPSQVATAPEEVMS